MTDFVSILVAKDVFILYLEVKLRARKIFWLRFSDKICYEIDSLMPDCHGCLLNRSVSL